MLRLASDADFDGRVLRALRLREPDLDLVRVQDVGLRTAADPEILEWAATQGRVLLTHDRKTMTKFAFLRMQAGLPMPGIAIVRQIAEDQIGSLLEQLMLCIHCSSQEDWKDRVEYLPW